MTLVEAREVFDKAFPESREILTPEGLVRKVLDNPVCFYRNNRYEIHAEGQLIGSSDFDPLLAWEAASQSIPWQYLEGFESKVADLHGRINPLGIYYEKKP